MARLGDTHVCLDEARVVLERRPCILLGLLPARELQPRLGAVGEQLGTHLLVQAVLAGAGTLILIGPADVGVGALWVFQASLATHLALAIGEATMRHPTAHAALAAENMLKGPYAGPYWVGMMFAVTGFVLVWMGFGTGALGGLIGLLLFEHAFVQAGQSVPLA